MDEAQSAIATLLDAAFRRSMITPVEWCETIRRMKGGKRYSFEYAPYQREIFESFFDEAVAVTVMALFSRGGKTELVTNLFGYSIMERPREMIMARPSQHSVENYSKNEFQGKLINPTPGLAEILPESVGRRVSHNTITSKYFPGGFINFIGVNSGGTIRTVQGDVVCCDEIDSYSTEQTDEGDKVDGVLGRADEYPNPIKVLTSYPLYAGDSHIWRWLGRSDWRQWTVRPKCGHEIVLHRNQLDWPKGDPSKAVLKCPECDYAIQDKERIRIVREGEWKATREFSGIRGYQANGMIWPHPHQGAYKNFLHQVAAQSEAVHRNQNPEKAKMVLVNRFDSEPFQPAEIAKPDPSSLVTRREKDWGVGEDLPDGVLAITFGADVQDSRIELEFVGFGANDETWGLGYHVIHGRPERQTTWAKVSELVKTKWNHPILGQIGIDGGCIDSRFRTDNVREWTVKHRTKNIFAISGSVVLGKPIIGKPRMDVTQIGTRKRQVQIYDVGTHEAKDRIYQRLLMDKAEGKYPAGYMHYPADDCYDERYFDGLTIEVPEMKRGGDGEWYRHFSAKSGQRNEPLDCRVYAMAAMLISRPPMRARAAKIGLKTVREEPKEGENMELKRKNRRKWRIGATTLGRANPF